MNKYALMFLAGVAAVAANEILKANGYNPIGSLASALTFRTQTAV